MIWRNLTVFAGVLCLFALLSPAASASGPEDAADLILRQGLFYPVVPAAPVRGSLAVRDGRIVYLGDEAGAAALEGPATQIVELAGRQVDLVGTGSYEEVVARVAAAASDQPPGSWILGRGWDQNDWAVQEFPTHETLSAAVPDHPVWIKRVDGHAALANARAMSVLEVDADREDPPGGRMLRDGDGHLTGVFVDRAKELVEGRLPAPDARELERRLRLAIRECLSLGLTTVTDMGVGAADYEAYRSLQAGGDLELRAALFLTDDADLLQSWFRRGPEIDPAGRLTVRGVKLYADGALGSRGAALLESYADDAGNLGLSVSSQDHLAEVAGAALEAGFQVGVHAIGDRGGLVALDALEQALGGPRPEVRFRLEHAQVLRQRDIRRLVELGIIASMQPTHATSDMPWAGERLGDERLHRAYAWRQVLDAGGRLALGSDFPVERPDPRLGLWAAVSRQDTTGQPPGGWLPEERLTPAEALRGFTLDAAYSLFLERQVGSLEVGKRADIVVFAADILAEKGPEMARVEVDMTLVDGKIVYRREVTR